MRSLLSGLLLAAAAALFALLFVLNAIIRTISRSTKIGFWETLLVFLALLLSIAALIANSIDAVPSELVQQVVLINVGILIIPSLLLALLESRREQGMKASRGIFGIGTGLLILLATFVIVPISASFFFPPPTETATATPQGTPPPATNTPTVTPTNSPTRTATLTMTPTSTRTPRPTATPTDTRRPAFPSRTPRPTETPVNPCVAQVENNLNLRTEPNLDAELLTTIPFNTSLAVFGRNEDSTWWYVAYEGQEGWVLGEYLLVTEPCYDLPVRDS